MGLSLDTNLSMIALGGVTLVCGLVLARKYYKNKPVEQDKPKEEEKEEPKKENNEELEV